MSIIVNIIICLLPPNDIRCACYQLSDSISEVQVQRSAIKRCLGKCSCYSAIKRRARNSHVEGQADSIPAAILVECATIEDDISNYAGILGNSFRIVAVVRQRKRDVDRHAATYLAASRSLTPKRQRVASRLAGDERELQIEALTSSNVDNLSHDSSAIDAQDDIAIVDAGTTTSNGGSDSLFAAIAQIARHLEVNRKRRHVARNGNSHSQFVTTDSSCHLIGIAIVTLLPATITMQTTHHLDIISAISYR